MADTLFAYLKGSVSNANETDPEDAVVFYNPAMEAHHNVLYYRRETLYFEESGETRALSFPVSSAASGWVGVMARVIGEAKLTTTGFDYASLAVTGVTRGYGVERHPGMISMVTESVTGFTWESLAASTTVEYAAMIFTEDDQL